MAFTEPQAEHMYKEAVQGFYQVFTLPKGRSTGIARKHAAYAMQNVCGKNKGYADMHPEVSQPEGIMVDQVSDLALLRGLQVFYNIQGRTEFLGVIVQSGMLEDGVVIHG